jgi:1-acyl-sn-glycerol-3-phosphate acyltransferase
LQLCSRTLEPRRSPGFAPGAATTLREAIPIVRGLARWWVDFRVVGGPVPDEPVVVAANHFAHVDPVIVSITVGRPIRYLALDELFGNNPLFDALTLWLGAIPLTREGVPLSAMRTAVAELEAGGTVGVFPEGRRVAAWGDVESKRGGAWLARRTGVPMVPVAISGTDEVMGLEEMRIRRRPVAGTVCEPILPRDYEGFEDPLGAITDEWERRIGEALRAVREE